MNPIPLHSGQFPITKVFSGKTVYWTGNSTKNNTMYVYSLKIGK